MRTVNIHEAKTHLSKLIEDAQKGERYIIAKSGKLIAWVSPISAPEGTAKKRLGFMAGQIQIPDDFDKMGQGSITTLFDGPA